MHAKYFMLHKVFYGAKLNNKQSAEVICRFDRLEQHTARVKSQIIIMEYLSAAHTFDYIQYSGLILA